MGPNARSVLQAIKRIDKLPELKTIAVGHGPLLHNQVNFWKEKYLEWSSNKSKGNDYVAVCYICLLYTSPSPRDISGSRMPSSA